MYLKTEIATAIEKYYSFIDKCWVFVNKLAHGCIPRSRSDQYKYWMRHCVFVIHRSKAFAIETRCSSKCIQNWSGFFPVYKGCLVSTDIINFDKIINRNVSFILSHFFNDNKNEINCLKSSFNWRWKLNYLKIKMDLFFSK